jgi:hypothetical protein
MKTKQMNLRLTEDELNGLNDAAKLCELPAATLCGFFIRAALRAVSNHAGPLRVPIDFQIVEREPLKPHRMELNEPKKLRK